VTGTLAPPPAPAPIPAPEAGDGGRARRSPGDELLDPARRRGLAPRADTALDATVDVVAATAATLLAAVGFRLTFGGLRWLAVAGIAAGAAALVAALARRHRWSPLLTIVTGVVTLLATGAVAVPDTAVAAVLPTAATPAALVDGFTGGWSRILTTVPPVGSADHLLAVVFVVCFLATHLAVTLARGTATTWFPALPALGVLVVAILVGTEVAPSAVLAGGALTALTLGWTAVRWRRRRATLRLGGSATDRQGVSAVVFLAAVTAAGCLLAPVLPFAHARDRYVVRERTEPPFDPRAHPSPLSQYKSWRLRAHPGGKEALDQRPVLTVSGLPEGVPLVLASLDLYDGTVWHVGGSPTNDDLTGSSRFERIGTDLTTARATSTGLATPAPDVPTTDVTVQVVNDAYEGPWLPMPPGATAVRFGGGRAAELGRELRYNRATGTAVVTGSFEPGDTLSVDAAVPVLAHAGDAERSRLLAGRDVDPAVRLPAVDDPTRALGGEANRLATGDGAYERARALEQALRAEGTGYFSDGTGTDGRTFTAGHTIGKIRDFLNQSDGEQTVHVGNAEKFAAAMATLARQLDLPARVVVGFRDGADDEHPPQRAGDSVVFTANQYDAWVEIAFEGRGWVAFHPTPPRSNGTPPPPRSTEPEVKDAEIQARPPVVPPPEVDPLTPQRKKDQDTVDDDEADEARAVPSWLVPVVRWAGGSVAVLAAIGLGIIGWKAWRRRRRRRRGDAVARLDGAWREVGDSLRDAGLRLAGGTRSQAAAAVPAERWAEAPTFAARLDAAMFGPAEPTDDDAALLWGDVDALRSHLHGQRRFLGRMAQALNPKTLWSWR